MTTAKSAFSNLKKTFQEWQKDDAFGKSAALAYYTIFSLPGLLLIIIQVAGLVWSPEYVQNELTAQISSMVGQDAAEQIRTVISNSQQSGQSTFAIIVGIATLIFGATGAFFQLQKSLNDAWGVEPKPDTGIKKMLLSRLTALGLVLAIGFLLMVSMLLTTAISILRTWIQENLTQLPPFMFFIVEELVSFGIFTVLFALIFKYLPDVKIQWRSVWRGALLTALLFTIGKFLLGFYFGNANPTSSFGSAGSVVLLLLWAYYSGLIFLFGAEFTQVYARKKGHEFQPTSFARYNAEYRLKHLEKHQAERV